MVIVGLPNASIKLFYRSLAAAEQLSKAGFGQLAWINGGFDAAAPSDLPVKGAADLRFGGIGGLSEVLGWTDVQKQTSQSEGFLGGGFTIIKLVSPELCPHPKMSAAYCTLQCIRALS